MKQHSLLALIMSYMQKLEPRGPAYTHEGVDPETGIHGRVVVNWYEVWLSELSRVRMLEQRSHRFCGSAIDLQAPQQHCVYKP